MNESDHDRIRAKARETIARLDHSISEWQDDPDRRVRAEACDRWQRAAAERKAEDDRLARLQAEARESVEAGQRRARGKHTERQDLPRPKIYFR